jgi:MFS family permease
MATRVITALSIAPPIGIGSGVVTELCPPEERAQKLGWWTLLTTVGIPAGPFIMGFVTQHLGVQWIFWIFSIINFAQLVAYLIFGAETVYLRDIDDYKPQPQKTRSGLLGYLNLPRRIDRRPFTLHDFVGPLSLCRIPRIFIPTAAYAIIFCYANIAIVVEMPIAFGEKFNFSPQQIGLQFIAIIIGSLIGEQLSGPMSDRFLKFLNERKGHAIAADRLWLSYIGYATVFAGLLTWGFQLENVESWNVTPCIGAAIASFGNQVLTTTLISFAVDSYKEHSTEIGVLVNGCRQVYGFVRSPLLHIFLCALKT